MSMIEWAAVIAAGFGAGAVNTIVGSGSLITYPVMVMLGVPPVTANIANTVGLVPGSIAGAWGYRDRLAGTKSLLLRLGAASVIGAVCGAILLTQLPKSAFAYVVPVLILGAALLVGFQPLIVKRSRPRESTRWGQLTFWVFLSGVYGGYFSAAQGVILLGVLGLFLASGLQEQNAVKNVLQALVNIVAAVFFIVVGGVAWKYALMVAIGSLIGAPVGAAIAKRIPTGPFRVGIVVFGVIMAGVMAWLARR
ncbi:sulfite exporter TauE/SafE family protein [soil metagenome]